MADEAINPNAHPPMETVTDMIAHMREMIEVDGLTNEQILELHPEIQSYFTQSE
jgi:hypothetical protein